MKKKKYVEVFPGAVCEKETFDKFVEACNKNPKLLDAWCDCFDECFRQEAKRQSKLSHEERDKELEL